MRRLLIRRFGLLIYLAYLLCGLFVLYQGRSSGLFPAPRPGMDQLSMLECAARLTGGVLPDGAYRYSYAYTLFLALLHAVTGGSLILMRILQLAVCSLIPVFIYRSARLLGLGRAAGQFGALCYLFYGPAMLISLDFLRAAPLALLFLLFFHLLLLGWRFRSWQYFAAAGGMGALCILGRENFAAVVPVVLAAWLLPAFRERAGWRSAAWYAAALFLPVLAVMLFNLALYGSFQPVPGNAGNVFAFYHGSETIRHFSSLAATLFRSVPVQFCSFLSSYELENSLSFYAHRELIVFLRVFLLPFHLLLALAFVGVWRYRRNGGVRTAFLLAALYAGSLLFFTMFYRFRIPAVPLIALLAGAGIAALTGWWKARNMRALAAVALSGALFLLLTSVTPDSRRSFAERAAVSRILIEQKRFREAESYLAKMARDGHDIRAGALLLAQRLAASGDSAWARVVVERFIGPVSTGEPAIRK